MPGEIYIKKAWKDKPLIKHIFLPNGMNVGPLQKIEAILPRIVISDMGPYEEREIADEEFIAIREANRSID